VLSLRTRFALAVPIYAWIVLAIAVGLIGGVIAYFVLRKHDKRMAEICLVIGMASTLFSVFVLPYLSF
jgi:cytochrome bd-type quinol oxidase subunit 1